MTRLPRIKGKKLVRDLQLAGFQISSTRGSHVFLRHADARPTAVPLHARGTIGPGLLRAILRDAEISPELLRKGKAAAPVARARRQALYWSPIPVRVCSLLPAATEILFALGAGDSVFGVTHECDYPPEAATRPALIRPRIDAAAPPAEIDRQVRERVERGESVYAVDASLLAALQPDLIVTQDLCHVCAASPDDLPAALARLAKVPQVVSLAPQRLADVWNDIRRLGVLVGRTAEAEALAARLEARAGAVEAAVRGAPRPRVLALEWLDPPFVGGHWVPEMIELAGGIPVLASAGVPSVALDWTEVLASEPDVVVLMPCGYNLERTLAEYSRATLPGGWRELPAVRAGRVAAVDANSYFSRSGPRLADGVEMLARILQPDLASAAIPPGSLEWVSSAPPGC